MRNVHDFANDERIDIEVGINSWGNELIISKQGYFIIPNPDYGRVSFSKENKDTCVGCITKDVIPNYTFEQYISDYGYRRLGTLKTVKEHFESIYPNAFLKEKENNLAMNEKLKSEEANKEASVFEETLYLSFAKYAGQSQDGKTDYEVGCIQTANALMPVISKLILKLQQHSLTDEV